MNKQTPSDGWNGVPLSDDRDIGPRLDIVGIEVADLTEAEALAVFHERVATKHFTPVAFFNAHCANTAQNDQIFSEALSQFAVLPDGIGVDLAAKSLHGRAFKANLNGTDFVPALLKSSPKPLKIALYGAAPGIADTAARAFCALDNRHEVRVVGNGFINKDAQLEMLEELRGWKPDVLLVALGVPRQEKWIVENLTTEHCTLPFAVGALFDFTAGTMPRAPQWMRRARMEWVFRLSQEPRRMFSRYIVGNPLFLLRVFIYKLQAKRGNKADG